MQTLIMHASDYQIVPISCYQFSKKHGTAHETILKPDFIEFAFVFCEYYCIIPTHRNHTGIVIFYPTIGRESMQQAHKLASYFLQTYKIRIGKLQYF